MTYQKRLVAALSEGFDIGAGSDGSVLLRPIGSTPDTWVTLIANDTDIETLVKTLVKDAVEALGEVGGDSSGQTAAVGLLAVHIEELIASDPDVSRVLVTASGARSGTDGKMH